MKNTASVSELIITLAEMPDFMRRLEVSEKLSTVSAVEQVEFSLLEGIPVLNVRFIDNGAENEFCSEISKSLMTEIKDFAPWLLKRPEPAVFHTPRPISTWVF